MKRYIIFFAFCFVCMSFMVFASEIEQGQEIVQDEQSKPTELPRSEATEAIEAVQDEQFEVEAEQSMSDFVPIEPIVPDNSEWYTPYDLPVSDYEYEMLQRLESIDYQLKIVAGGMVLAAISLFIWFTILKPIKQFSRF